MNEIPARLENKCSLKYDLYGITPKAEANSYREQHFQAIQAIVVEGVGKLRRRPEQQLSGTHITPPFIRRILIRARPAWTLVCGVADGAGLCTILTD